MRNRDNTSHQKTHPIGRRRLSCQEARSVFSDPVAYLERHGIGAELVEVAKRPFASAA